MADLIDIQVVHARPERQELVDLRLAPGTTLQQALEASGLLRKHPEITLADGRFGIYSHPAKLDTVLRDRDRVEIYRPLLADPKERRRQRAAEGKLMKQGAATEPPSA